MCVLFVGGVDVQEHGSIVGICAHAWLLRTNKTRTHEMYIGLISTIHSNVTAIDVTTM